jgi:predicted lipoprotein with Yx(FWY)xxD motif
VKPLRILFIPLSLFALAAAGPALGQPAHASAVRTVVSTHHTSLGTFLVNSSGKTLYLDSADKPGHPACTGGCLTVWPPLKASGALKASGSAKAADLGTTKGPGGIKQVTYKGHPLYTFASDSTSNPTSGEGVNSFYVVSPSGSKITKSKGTTTTPYTAPGY